MRAGRGFCVALVGEKARGSLQGPGSRLFLDEYPRKGHNRVLAGNKQHLPQRGCHFARRHTAMMEIFDHPISQAGLLFAAMFGMTALGVEVARRFRDSSAQDMQDSSKIMSNFRELHAQGGLSDEEFRTIKTKLAAEINAELQPGLNSNSDND